MTYRILQFLFVKLPPNFYPGDRIRKSCILQLSDSFIIMLKTGYLQNRPHQILKKNRRYRPYLDNAFVLGTTLKGLTGR
jgi:hypothetical protein